MSRLFNVSRLARHSILLNIASGTHTCSYCILKIRYPCHQAVWYAPKLENTSSKCCYSTESRHPPSSSGVTNFKISDFFNTQSSSTVSDDSIQNQIFSEPLPWVGLSDTLDKILPELETLLKYNNIMMMPQFRKVMQLAREADTLTREQAALLMFCTAQHTIILPLKEKVQLIKDLWQLFKDKGVPFDVALFNARYNHMNAVDALSSLSVAEEQAEMRRYNIRPDHIAYGMFLKMYCQSGEVAAARELLEVMKRRGTKTTIIHYNDLIHGHFIAGDPETAIQMYKSVGDCDLVPNNYSHGELFVGYARIGEHDKMKVMLSGPDPAAIPHYLQQAALQILVKNGHYDIAHELLLLMPVQISGAVCRDLMISLLDKGLYDTAILLHQRTKLSNLCSFARTAVCSNINADELYLCLTRIKEEVMDAESGMDQYYVVPYLSNDPDRLVVYLEVARRMGETEVKPHYYYPAVVGYCKAGNLDGVLSVLPKLFTGECVDKKSSVQILVSSLTKMGKSLDEIIVFLQENVPVEAKPYVNFLLILHVLDQGPQKVIEFLNGVDSLDADELLIGDLRAKLFRAFVPHRMDTLFLLLAAVCKKKTMDLDFFYEAVFRRLLNDGRQVELMLNLIYENDMTDTLSPAVIDLLRPHVSSEMQTKLSELQDSLNLSVGDPVKVPVFRVKGELIKLLADLATAKKTSKVLKVEDQMEKQNIEITSYRIALQMAKFHMNITKNAEKAFHYYFRSVNISTEHPQGKPPVGQGFMPTRFMPMEIAAMFAENHDIDSAIRVLRCSEVFIQKHQVTIGHSNSINQYHADMKRLINLCDNFEHLCEILRVGTENGFLHNLYEQQTAWDTFFQVIAKRGDHEELVNTVLLAYKHLEKDHFTTGIHSLFVSLINESNKDALMCLLPVVRQYLGWSVSGRSESMVEHLMALAFMEAGRTPVALKIVKNPAFKVNMMIIWQYYDYYMRINEPDRMLNLYDIMKNCKDIEKDTLLFMCMKAYHNASPFQEARARAVFEVKFKEENVVPSGRTQKYYYRNVRHKFSEPYVKR